MEIKSLYERYEKLYLSLDQIILESENRVTCSEPDFLFFNNINFYVKSYLINICTYLEAFLQDVSFWYSYDMNKRLKAASIPHNYIYWRSSEKIKEKNLKFTEANLSLNKKEISDELSPNPYKTIKLFQLLGIDLAPVEGFYKNKDFIASIVSKRNNIIHHNDNAMDISFADLRNYIIVTIEYMKSIESAIEKMKL